MIQAGNGSEGLDIARTEHPALVITDMLMPVMDGYQFVRQLRLDPELLHTPVLFYTAPYGEREARALSRVTGTSYVLTKPGEPGEVLKIVERVLLGESAAPVSTTGSVASSKSNREQLRLLTDTLTEKRTDLRIANARLRAVVNIGLEIASESDPVRLLESVCAAAHDLFGATYATLGTVDRNEHTMQRLVTCGTTANRWIARGDGVPGILGMVVADRRTIRGVNPDGDPTALQLPAEHPKIEAFLATPIASPTQVHGWICLVGNEGRTFTDDDEQLIAVLSGQVGRVYELEHEMAERQEAEAALRRERDRAQQYLDTAEVILLALDLDGRVTLINRKGCSLLERTEAELLGCDWIDTCLPERLRAVSRPLLRQLATGTMPVDEAPIVSRSGKEFLIEWRNTVSRDDAGKIVGTFSSGADVTERTTAVVALRRAEERTRFALEAAGVGIWDMDYATGKLEWSAILEHQYGLEPGAFGGTFDAFVAGVHPDDRERVLETMATANHSGRDFSIDHRSLHPDGTVRWLTGAGRVDVGPDGNPVRGLGISLDVTERHTLELQYQQAQKMEAIGRLAGGVAHDFNNLLTVILGNCEIARADLAPDDPHQEEIIEIQKAATSAAGLTRQLLAFSRKQIIEPAVLDLNAILAEMRAMLGRLLPENVKVVMQLPPRIARITADRGQVEQIIMNLVVNARDAMPRGGTLTIATADLAQPDHHTTTHFQTGPVRM